jgi:hypothetical protein
MIDLEKIIRSHVLYTDRSDLPADLYLNLYAPYVYPDLCTIIKVYSGDLLTSDTVEAMCCRIFTQTDAINEEIKMIQLLRSSTYNNLTVSEILKLLSFDREMLTLSMKMIGIMCNIKAFPELM